MSQSESQYPDASVQSESGPVVVTQTNSRLKSEAWNYFNKVGTKAVCRHCGTELTTGPKSGTTHLCRHIKDACKKIIEEERKKFGLGKDSDMFGTSNYKFNSEVTRSLMTLLFIDAEIPFAVIENRFFEASMRSLRPEYKVVGRQTLRNDCVEVYKKGLAVSWKEFEELDSCVSFTADIWTSSVNLGYLCLTAHFIDKNFNFKKKIIGSRQMSYPHSGPAVASLIEKILVEWKLDAKIFTITLDNSTVNDNAIEKALKKIREILRRIASSGKRLQFFNDILKELQLGEKKDGLLEVPISDEWKEAKELAKFLEVFFYATKTFSTVRRPCSHLYMKEVWTIGAMLMEDYMSFNQTLQDLAQKMLPKFNKYWENPNLILILACVFDPRVKLEDIEFFLGDAYGDETDEYKKRLEDVRSSLRKCYDDYASMCNVDRATSGGSPQVESSSLGKRKFDMKLSEFKFQKRHMRPRRSELDNYLEEAVVECDEENFDILQWWKRNSDLYPTLAKMERDFLAVQVSTVASESAFSAAGRLTDHSRNSMNAKTIQALICSRDWFYSIDGGFDLEQFRPFMQAP
ncbi:zinc finger BED domain-containing protein RICESLEEPER 2-like [Carex rostrata]